MGRLGNAHDNHVTRWVVPAARRLLIDAAVQGGPVLSLSEVAELEMGQSPPGDSCNISGDGVPLIGGPSDLGLEHPEPSRFTTAPTKLCQAKDIIVCVRATIGEPRLSDGVYCLGRGVAAIRPIDSSWRGDFLFRVVQANEDFLKGLGTGTTFKTVSKQHIGRIPVPLLESAEQKAIADFLAWLERPSSNGLDFREAPILPARMSFVLHSVKRIEALAAKIEEARGLKTEALEGAASIVGAVSRYLIDSFETASRYSIDDVSEVRSGIQKGPHRAPGANPVRYLTVAHVQRDHISLDDPRFFEVTSSELARWRLLPGDVLIIEGNGSASQIGRTALFRGEIDNCVHQNHVIRIRPDPTRIDPEFLNMYLNSPVGQTEVQAQSRSTSGLRTLSVGRIKSIEVPAMPLSQQSRIISELADLRRKIAVISRLQAESTEEINVLLPAILDRAFRGEL